MSSYFMVNKGGDVLIKKSSQALVDQLDRLYTKCGFPNGKEFGLQHCWKTKYGYVSVYAKTCGRPFNENKLELPPPIDNTIFYGRMIMIISNDQERNDIIDVYNHETITWEKVYETLFGGFDDVGSNDDYESDELENVPEEELTKKGKYLKDGFVVEDEEEDEYAYHSTSGEDEDEYDSELSFESYDYGDDDSEEEMDYSSSDEE